MHAPGEDVRGSFADLLRSVAQRATARPANTLLALTCFLLSAVLHYPGHVPYDGITVWYEARHAVHFSQHPPAMALLLHYLDAIMPGPGLYSVLQLAVLWFATWVFTEVVRPRVIVAVALYGLLLTYPLVLAMDGLLVKDILSTHLALLAVLLVMTPGAIGKDLRLQGMIVFGLLAVATLLRYQFAILVPVLGLYFGWRVGWRQAMGSLVLSLAAFLAVTAAVEADIHRVFQFRSVGTLDRNLGANDIERSMRKIMIYDIAGVVIHDPGQSLEVLASSGVDVGTLKTTVRTTYSSYHVDTMWVPGGVFAQLAKVPESAIAVQWRRSVLAAPGAFLTHRMVTFARVLGIGSVNDCFPAFAGISRTPASRAQDVGADHYRPALSSTIMHSRYFPVAVLFHAFPYALIAIAIVLLCLLGRAPVEAGLIAFSGLVYESTFLVLPQACDVRYSYFLVLTAIFGGTLALLLPPIARKA